MESHWHSGWGSGMCRIGRQGQGGAGQPPCLSSVQRLLHREGLYSWRLLEKLAVYLLLHQRHPHPTQQALGVQSKPLAPQSLLELQGSPPSMLIQAVAHDFVVAQPNSSSMWPN